MDARDREAHESKWYDSFNEKSMSFTVTLFNIALDEDYEATFPAKYEVCYLCQGKGKYVNPSIDAHGISAEEFYEDPDFAEDYMSGTYDVQCFCCDGSRVEPVIDEEAINRGSDQLQLDYARLQDYLKDRAYSYACEAAERRMGA